MKSSWFVFFFMIVYGVTPFVMLVLETKIHGSKLYAVKCPVFWSIAGGAIVAFAICAMLYPSSQAIVSIFVFAISLPLAIGAQYSPAANRGSSSK